MSRTDDTSHGPSEPARFAGPVRRLRRSTTVRTLVVAALVLGGLAGTGASSGVSLPDEEAARPDAAVVSLDCTGYRIDVHAQKQYYLHVQVVDEASGERFRAIGGPFTGPVAERTDGTALIITAVEVLYADGGGTSAARPGGC